MSYLLRIFHTDLWQSQEFYMRKFLNKLRGTGSHTYFQLCYLQGIYGG